MWSQALHICFDWLFLYHGRGQTFFKHRTSWTTKSTYTTNLMCPDNTYRRQWAESSLVQTIAPCLLGDKPSPEPLVTLSTEVSGNQPNAMQTQTRSHVHSILPVYYSIFSYGFMTCVCGVCWGGGRSEWIGYFITLYNGCNITYLCWD